MACSSVRQLVSSKEASVERVPLPMLTTTLVLAVEVATVGALLSKKRFKVLDILDA